MSEPLTVQHLSAILAVLSFVVASAGLLLARRVNGEAPASTRLALLAVWLLSLTAVYSATSFLWAPDLPDDVWDILRLAPLAIRTTVLVVLLALALFYWRRYRRGS